MLSLKNVRVLITGMGGAAGIGVYRGLLETGVTLFCGDMDPLAAGLYFVEPEYRCLLPRGDAPGYAEALLRMCRSTGIDIVIPTVDAELIPLASQKDDFLSAGVRLMTSEAQALRGVLDKWKLVRHLHSNVPCPETAVFYGRGELAQDHQRVVVKPRCGSGGRDIFAGPYADVPHTIPKDGSFIVQEYLPGEEFSVDVLLDRDSKVLSAVPRERLKVDSGIAVTCRSVKDPELIELASRAAQVSGLRYAVNVQMRRDGMGRPKLLEVNPRFPGSIALTIASGVNMPLLALRGLLNLDGCKSVEFQERILIRYLEERVVSHEDFQKMHRVPNATLAKPSDETFAPA